MGTKQDSTFGAFCQLAPNALTLVTSSGCELPFATSFPAAQSLGPDQALGVLFTFVPKYTLASGLGTAFFCHFCGVAPQLAPQYPVCLLSHLVAKGLLRRSSSRLLLDPTFFSPSALASYLGHLAGKPGLSPNNPFKPHSLRIGGHTWYTVHGMDPDLRDYLARRAINRCSLRYFRAAPASNLNALRNFYARVPSTTPAPAPSKSHSS